ncbi:neutral amino acid transporter [Linnemannia zychae]|nr:neutral amino acid transporter [Linnemannia zychae]
MSGPSADSRTAAGAVASLELEDSSQDTIMNPLGHAPVYSSRDDHEQHTHFGSSKSSDDNGDNDQSINNDNNPSNTQTPQALSGEPQGGTRTDEALARQQKWLKSPKGPRKTTRIPPKSGQVPNSGIGNGVGTGPGTAPRHDVNQDPCAIISGGGSFGGGPISYDLIKGCLDSDFGFPIEVRQDTVDTVKSLITNFYVFEDLAAHPPREEWVQHLSFQPVELIKEIDAWLEQSKAPVDAVDDQGTGEVGGTGSSDPETEKNSQDLKQDEVVEDNDDDDKDDVDTLEAQGAWGRVFTKMTDREFHDGISRILLKARDGHLSYDADCFRAFRFQHGFFMSHVVRDGKTVIKVHSVAPYFPFQNGVKEDILNCDVLTIDRRDAVDYIQDWADRYVSMSKDHNVRFNAALATPQYRSGLADFFLPGKFSERFTLPTEKSLHFTFRCPTNSNLRLNVKWVGFYTHEQTKPFTNAETYFKSNCIKDSSDIFGDSEDEFQDPERSKFEKQEDSEKKDISELKSSLRELLIQGVPPSSTPSDTKPAADHLHELPPQELNPLEEGGANPPLQNPEEALSKHFDEIVTKLDMISSVRLPVVKFYDDYGGRVGEMNQAMGAPPFKQLYEGRHGITALMMNDGKTGVITVRTESSTIRGEAYSRVHPAWAGSLLHAIKVLRPHAENLILDLSHNTGGYVCLGLTMVQIFFPERPRLVTNIRLSPLSTQMMTAGAMGMDHFISSYGEVPISALQSGSVVKPIKHPHRNLTFSDFLSDRCAIADTYTLTYDPAEESRRKRAQSSYGTMTENSNDDGDVQYRPWDPENLAILTDGYCGSSCALISNMMHTKFGVPTVVVGGRDIANDGPMSYSTFPGLQVVDDALLFTEMHDVRTDMMSSEEVHRLEDGGRRRKFQAAFSAENRVRDQSGDDEDEDEDEDKSTGGSQSPDTAKIDGAEDEDGDYDTFYPLTFVQKGRLRLTWRQIYNTGPELELFKLKSFDDGDEVYEPAWNLTDKWHEYSFIPANYRIDYTDHNVHSIGAIWEDARDALWGSSSARGGDDDDANADGGGGNFESSQGKVKAPATTPVGPISDQPTTTSTTITDTIDSNSMTEAETLARSKSTKRLLARPTREALTINTTASPAISEDERLHAIVGQHLAMTPTIPEATALPSPVIPPTPSTAYNLSLPLNPQRVSMEDGSSTPQATTNRHSLASFATSTTLATPSDPMNNKGSSSNDDSTELMKEEPVASSHFNLLGADVSNDVYKWHEKEQRRQMLGGRSHTFHATPTNEDPDITNIKAPGGFRRHFIQQDAAARGEPVPQLATKSFIHFLGLFNMYEMDHFAGEDFHSIPRRSIVVPKDLDKRRKSLSETLHSNRRVYHPGQPLEDDEEVIEEPEEKISFSKAVGMLFKSFIASGILFLPNAFKNGGILFAPLFMTLIAVLCLHSFLLLVKCRELHPGSFGDIGQHFYGRWMRYIVLFAIAISQFGFCCGYCIFFAQQFAAAVENMGGAQLNKIVWIAIFFVILIPFTLIRNIGRLGFSAVLADLCIIVGLIYLYAYDIKQLVIHQGSPTPLQLFNSKDFGLFVGTAVFSYEGIGMVIPICSSMANPKQFPRALTIVLSVVCVLLVSFGSLGYAAYGDNVKTIVLDDLPNQTGGEKAGKNAIQLLYVIAIFLTTPLMLFPCIRIVENCCKKILGENDIGTKKRMMKENVVRILIDFAVAAVAYAGYYKLDIVISFIGSFACAPLLFIFPPLFHVKAFPNQPLWRKISDIVLILFGFLVFFYTLVITIQSFSRGGGGGH